MRSSSNSRSRSSTEAEKQQRTRQRAMTCVRPSSSSSLSVSCSSSGREGAYALNYGRAVIIFFFFHRFPSFWSSSSSSQLRSNRPAEQKMKTNTTERTFCLHFMCARSCVFRQQRAPPALLIIYTRETQIVPGIQFKRLRKRVAHERVARY